MIKFGLSSIAAFALSLSAFADRDAALSGDEDFLADAYEAAETGADFSYARVWGEGRAYDGTDTSAFYQGLKAQAAAEEAAKAETKARSGFITRSAANPAPPTKTRIPLRGRLTD